MYQTNSIFYLKNSKYLLTSEIVKNTYFGKKKLIFLVFSDYMTCNPVNSVWRSISYLRPNDKYWQKKKTTDGITSKDNWSSAIFHA